MDLCFQSMIVAHFLFVSIFIFTKSRDLQLANCCLICASNNFVACDAYDEKKKSSKKISMVARRNLAESISPILYLLGVS